MKNNLNIDPDEWFIDPPKIKEVKAKKVQPTLHEKMYDLATKGGKHTIGGGSETIQKTD